MSNDLLREVIQEVFYLGKKRLSDKTKVLTMECIAYGIPLQDVLDIVRNNRDSNRHTQRILRTWLSDPKVWSEDTNSSRQNQSQ